MMMTATIYLGVWPLLVPHAPSTCPNTTKTLKTAHHGLTVMVAPQPMTTKEAQDAGGPELAGPWPACFIQ
jgi:hypothetical protein